MPWKIFTLDRANCTEGKQKAMWLNMAIRDEKESKVYFLLITSDGENKGREGLIKIGYTINLSRRLSTYRIKNGLKFEVMGVMRGGPILERHLHEKFSSYLVHGVEWFQSAPELIGWIWKMFPTTEQLQLPLFV